MKVLLVTDNLMTRAGLRGGLAGTGAEILPGAAEGAPDLIVVDLTARDAAGAVGRLRATHPEAPILAFGPHVDGAAFSAARAAGADEAVARGKALERIRSRIGAQEPGP